MGNEMNILEANTMPASMVLLMSKDKNVLGKSTPTGIDGPTERLLQSSSHLLKQGDDVISTKQFENKSSTRNLQDNLKSNETAINILRSPANIDQNQIVLDNPFPEQADPYIDYLCSKSNVFKSFNQKSRPLSAISSKYRLVKHSNLYPNR